MTVYQAHNNPSTSVVYDGSVVVGDTACSNTSFTSTGGTATLSATCYQYGRTKYSSWPSGAADSYSSYNTTTNRTPSFKFTVTPPSGFSISGSTLTVPKNTGKAREVFVQAYYGTTNSAFTVKITQAAGIVKTPINIGVHYEIQDRNESYFEISASEPVTSDVKLYIQLMDTGSLDKTEGTFAVTIPNGDD